MMGYTRRQKSAAVHSGEVRVVQSRKIKNLKQSLREHLEKVHLGKAVAVTQREDLAMREKNGQKNQKSRFMMWVAQSIQKDMKKVPNPADSIFL